MEFANFDRAVGAAIIGSDDFLLDLGGDAPFDLCGAAFAVDGISDLKAVVVVAREGLAELLDPKREALFACRVRDAAGVAVFWIAVPDAISRDPILEVVVRGDGLRERVT